MHRWLHKLLGGAVYAPNDEGGTAPPSSSAADTGGGAPPAAPSSGDAPAASPPPSTAPTSSEPSAGGEAAPISTQADAGDPFDFMDSDGDELGIVPVEPPAGFAEGTPAPQAAPPPPAQQVPTQAPGGQAPQGAPAQASDASPIPTDPGELVDSIRANAPALIEQMAKSYVLSPEEAEALENDVVGTLPKILARVHLNASMGALHNMKQLIPQMIKQAIHGDRAKRDNLETFYKAWPQLDRGNKDHQAAITQLGSAYRRANPMATREQAIKAIGVLALHHLGLPITNPASVGGPNGRTVSQKPFVPAIGGSPAAPASSPEYDPFWGMGEHFDE